MTYSDGRAERTFGRRGVPAQPEPVKRGFRSASARVPTIADLPSLDRDADSATFSGHASGVATSEVTPALVALYVGPNSDKYLAMYAKMKEKDPDLRSLAMGWCWPVFFVPIPWLLYRKQWGIAAAIIILPIVVAYLFPDLAIGSGAIGLVLAILAKSVYVKFAASRIRGILATETDPDLRRIAIVQAGGVSVPGAIIGTVVLIAGIIVTLVNAAADLAAISAVTAP